MQDSVPHSVRSPEEPTPPSGPPSFLSDSLIKQERHSPSHNRCHSPSSPSNYPTHPLPPIPSFTAGRTATHNTRKKRSAHPYTHPPPRVTSGRRQTTSDMSAPHYTNWSSNTVKYEQSDFSSGDLSHAQRRSSDGDQQPPYYFASVSKSAPIISGNAIADAFRSPRITLCTATAQISVPSLRDPLLQVSPEQWANPPNRRIPPLQVIGLSKIHHDPPTSSLVLPLTPWTGTLTSLNPTTSSSLPEFLPPRITLLPRLHPPTPIYTTRVIISSMPPTFTNSPDPSSHTPNSPLVPAQPPPPFPRSSRPPSLFP